MTCTQQTVNIEAHAFIITRGKMTFLAILVKNEEVIFGPKNFAGGTYTKKWPIWPISAIGESQILIRPLVTWLKNQKIVRRTLKF